MERGNQIKIKNTTSRYILKLNRKESFTILGYEAGHEHDITD